MQDLKKLPLLLLSIVLLAVGLQAQVPEPQPTPQPVPELAGVYELLTPEGHPVETGHTWTVDIQLTDNGYADRCFRDGLYNYGESARYIQLGPGLYIFENNWGNYGICEAISEGRWKCTMTTGNNIGNVSILTPLQ